MSSAFKASAVLYVKNLDRVQTFYREVFDLQLMHTEDDHVILESSIFQLVILRIPSALASSVIIESPPKLRTQTPIKLVFFVPSLSIARDKALANGGNLKSPEHEWEFQGCRVCDGYDPEGNIVQLRQHIVCVGKF